MRHRDNEFERRAAGSRYVRKATGIAAAGAAGLTALFAGGIAVSNNQSAAVG
jgi:hypothetical protein